MNWLIYHSKKYISASAAILYHKAENLLGYKRYLLPMKYISVLAAIFYQKE